MRRKPRRDLVTAPTRYAVLSRDQWRCVAPDLDPTAGDCRNEFGDPNRPGDLELHHVKDQPRMGVRAESDPEHLVALCPWHHRYSGWGTSRHGLGLLRQYLAGVKQTGFPTRQSEPPSDAPDQATLPLSGEGEPS
ncbi:MAG: hypothetical protein MUE61_08330 [Vicinamibacterales bacterium]|nr:hypothetical protein [Vicinamibacterales bacterium]MCU0562318.1 hypothetical protein [Desulfobacterales bacterium]